MALVSQILNRVNCDASGMLGTGNYFCPIDIKLIVAGIRMPSSFRIPADTDFNLEYIREQQQLGNFVVVSGITNMANNTPENSYTTQDNSGINTLNLKSPYLWNFSFNAGLYNYKALATMESGSGYAWMWIDTAGNVFGAVDGQGNLRGLKTHLFSVNPYVAGNDNTHTVAVQTDRGDFDKNVAWITAENVDFDGNDLAGWNDVVLTLTAPSAGNSLTFTAFSEASNKAVAFEGLVKEDFLVTSGANNATNIITLLVPDALVSVNGKYVITLTTALTTGQTVTLRMFDSVLNANIIDVDSTGLFKSNVATTVVV